MFHLRPEQSLQRLAGADRIERIRTQTEARVEVSLYMPGCQRVIRKDYNIVAAKMFLARGVHAQNISAALRDLERSAIETELLVNPYRSEAVVELDVQCFQIRVISAFSNRYHMAVRRIDAALKVLLLAEARGDIDRRRRMEIHHGTMQPIHELKRVALDLPLRQDAHTAH